MLISPFHLNDLQFCIYTYIHRIQKQALFKITKKNKSLISRVRSLISLKVLIISVDIECMINIDYQLILNLISLFRKDS